MSEHGCHLCKTKHPLFIHEIFERQVRIDGKVRVLLSLRLLCPVNRRLRKENKTNLQYTQRVLPSFLFPWGRVFTHGVIGAIDAYDRGQAKDFALAAACGGWKSPKSFSRYFHRATNRLRKWLDETVAILVEIGGRIPDSTPSKINTFSRRDRVLNGQWNYFRKCLDIIGNQRIRATELRAYADVVLWFFNRMNPARMGLGP